MDANRLMERGENRRISADKALELCGLGIVISFVILLTACGSSRENLDLLLAIKHGNLAGVQDSITKGADPNLVHIEDDWKTTPLLFALRFVNSREQMLAPSPHRVTIVEELLNNGADPNLLTNANSPSPLHIAVASGIRRPVQILLKSGADANARDGLGRTPIFLASSFVLRDVDIRDVIRKRPGYDPRRASIEWIVDVLTANGADINATDATGNTIMQVWGVDQRPDIVGYLIAEGVSPLVQNNRGQSPLHALAATARDGFSRVSSEKLSVLKILLKHTQYPFGVDVDGNDPLHCLLRQCNLDMSKPDTFAFSVNCRSTHSYAHLRYQQREPRSSEPTLADFAAEFTRNHKFQDTKNLLGITPIQMALEFGERDTAAVLLSSSHRGLREHQPEEVSVLGLKDLGDDILFSRAILAAIWNNEQYFNEQLDPVEINQTDAWGRSALVWAVKYENYGLAKRLIELGADMLTIDQFGASLFHFPSSFELWPKSQNAELTLAVNATDVNGDSPLSLAVEAGKINAIESLLRLGADAKARDLKHECRSPLMKIAARRNEPKIVSLLVDAGASVDLKFLDPNDRPITIAVESDSPAVVRELLQLGAKADFKVRYVHRLESGELLRQLKLRTQRYMTDSKEDVLPPNAGVPKELSLLELARIRGYVDVERELRFREKDN